MQRPRRRKAPITAPLTDLTLSDEEVHEPFSDPVLEGFTQQPNTEGDNAKAAATDRTEFVPHAKENVLVEDITGHSDSSEDEGMAVEFAEERTVTADMSQAVVLLNVPLQSYMPRDSDDEVLNIRPLSMIPMTDSFMADMEEEKEAATSAGNAAQSQEAMSEAETAAKSDAGKSNDVVQEGREPTLQLFKVPAEGGYSAAEEIPVTESL